MSNHKRKKPKVDKPDHNFAIKVEKRILQPTTKVKLKKDNPKFEVSVDFTLEEHKGLLASLETLRVVYAQAHHRLKKAGKNDEASEVQKAYTQAAQYKDILRQRAQSIN